MRTHCQHIVAFLQKEIEDREAVHLPSPPHFFVRFAYRLASALDSTSNTMYVLDIFHLTCTFSFDFHVRTNGTEGIVQWKHCSYRTYGSWSAAMSQSSPLSGLW
jgi:hypothetical protein